MSVAILTHEYPLNVHGGGGVHVDYPTRELAALEDHPVQALGFGGRHIDSASFRVRGIQAPSRGIARPTARCYADQVARHRREKR